MLWVWWWGRGSRGLVMAGMGVLFYKGDVVTIEQRPKRSEGMSRDLGERASQEGGTAYAKALGWTYLRHV